MLTGVLWGETYQQASNLKEGDLRKLNLLVGFSPANPALETG